MCGIIARKYVAPPPGGQGKTGRPPARPSAHSPVRRLVRQSRPADNPARRFVVCPRHGVTVQTLVVFLLRARGPTRPEIGRHGAVVRVVVIVEPLTGRFRDQPCRRGRVEHDVVDELVESRIAFGSISAVRRSSGDDSGDSTLQAQSPLTASRRLKSPRMPNAVPSSARRSAQDLSSRNWSRSVAQVCTRDSSESCCADQHPDFRCTETRRRCRPPRATVTSVPQRLKGAGSPRIPGRRGAGSRSPCGWRIR